MAFVKLPGGVPPAGAPAAPADTHPARFTGHSGALWRILLRGSLLLAVTLGIYRFWLATDIRRFLWAHTEVNGQSLEYTGTATELLIGFLIAIAILVPINLMFFVFALNMGPLGEAATVLAFPILAFLGQYAVFRARRYRLTRTVFRGVRFHQSGSAWRYAVCAIFWWVMIFLTLGLAYPFAQSRLERFKMRNTWYGNLQGRFEGTGFNLLLRGLPLWLLVMGPLVFAVVIGTTVDWTAVVTAAALSSGASDFISTLETAEGFYVAVLAAFAAVCLSVTMAALLFPAFQALTLRWWASGVRFGELSVRSRLRTAQIYGAYLRFLGWGIVLLILTIILLGIGVGVFFAVFGIEGQTEARELAGTVGGVACYVIVMLGFSAIYQVTVKLTLWRRGVESLELSGLGVLDNVKAEGLPGSAVGEGLADALNVGGF